MSTDTDLAAETPKIIRLGERFGVRQEIDNLAWIDLGEYAIVVDALEHAELEGEIFETLTAELGGESVRYVLNTHTHYDHVALNPAFAARGAKIINAETETIPPEGKWFRGSQRSVLMLPMPGCHTSEDCVIWVEPEKALFVGDIFGWGCIPLIVNLRADTDKLLVDTYRRMLDMGPKVVIPGHGPLCTAKALQRWLMYFSWLKREIARTCAAGASDEEIIRLMTPPEDMKSWWRFLKWKHADSVAKVLKAVRKGWL